MSNCFVDPKNPCGHCLGCYSEKLDYFTVGKPPEEDSGGISFTSSFASPIALCASVQTTESC